VVVVCVVGIRHTWGIRDPYLTERTDTHLSSASQSRQRAYHAQCTVRIACSTEELGAPVWIAPAIKRPSVALCVVRIVQSDRGSIAPSVAEHGHRHRHFIF
jgi:hypothetical protein